MAISDTTNQTVTLDWCDHTAACECPECVARREPVPTALPDPTTPRLLSMSVFRRPGSTAIFMRLPRELWRSCGPCNCPVCKGAEGYWDTLAVAQSAVKGKPDFTWTVHYPEIQ